MYSWLLAEQAKHLPQTFAAEGILPAFLILNSTGSNTKNQQVYNRSEKDY